MSYLVYPYVFTPLLHLPSSEAAVLEGVFKDQSVEPTFRLHALRRLDAWATTLPVGVFANDFRPFCVPPAAQVAWFDGKFTEARSASRTRRKPLRDPHRLLMRGNHTFFHLEALRFLRPQVEMPYFLDAIYRFMLDATNDTSLIIPKKPRRPYVPPERRKDVFGLKGMMCRGPGWTAEEDAVLRRWFGQRTTGPSAGHHEALTEEQWVRVLEGELQGRRSKQSVRNRFVTLNQKLADRFLVDGFIPRDSIRLYMAEAIGECPRIPPVHRPRPRKPHKPRGTTSPAL